MRLGVLGGCFNPVHLGHLILAQDALELCALDRVLFVPCQRPPHKPADALAPAADRRAMLAAALAGDPRFAICDLELQRGGTTYTIDTARALAALYPRDELVFLIGADTLPELPGWKDAPALLKACRFVALARPGYPPAPAASAAGGVPVRVIAGHPAAISSSDIRRRAARGLSLRYLVPDAVERYVREHGLYRASDSPQEETPPGGP